MQKTFFREQMRDAEHKTIWGRDLKRDEADSLATNSVNTTRRKVLAVLGLGAAASLVELLYDCSGKARKIIEQLSPPALPDMREAGEAEDAVMFLNKAMNFFQIFTDEKRKAYAPILAKYENGLMYKDENYYQKKKYLEHLGNQANEWRNILSSLDPRRIDDIFLLANVAYNETSGQNPKAIAAVVHAYLNRKQDKPVPPHGKAEIPDYKSLSNRFEVMDDNGKYLFLKALIPTSEIADEILRMSPEERKKVDPTEGATHWISPKNLPDKDPGKGYYRRRFVIDGKAVYKYCPVWARKNNDPEVRKKTGVFFDPTYRESAVKGVEKRDFYFYRGVY